MPTEWSSPRQMERQRNVSIRNSTLTTANEWHFLREIFQRKGWQFKSPLNFFLETCAALVSLILVNLHVRVPPRSVPLDKRGEHQDAKESRSAALVTFWLTSLTGSSTYSRMGGLSLLWQRQISFPNT